MIVADSSPVHSAAGAALAAEAVEDPAGLVASGAAQGHAPYVWGVLGAVAQVTERVDLMTYVTCPTLRYHPAVDARQDMLAEAIEIIRALHTGELTTWEGDYYRVDSARIWDLPEQGVDLVQAWNATDGAPRIGAAARAIGQIPICWDPDRDTAVQRAHEQFRWFAGGWAVNADLPTTAGFAGATAYVRPQDVALVQVGGDSVDGFLAEAAEPLLDKLRAAAPS